MTVPSQLTGALLVSAVSACPALHPDKGSGLRRVGGTTVDDINPPFRSGSKSMGIMVCSLF